MEITILFQTYMYIYSWHSFEIFESSKKLRVIIISQKSLWLWFKHIHLAHELILEPFLNTIDNLRSGEQSAPFASLILIWRAIWKFWPMFKNLSCSDQSQSAQIAKQCFKWNRSDAFLKIRSFTVLDLTDFTQILFFQLSWNNVFSSDIIDTELPRLTEFI